MSNPHNPTLWVNGQADTEITLRDLFAAFALAGLIGGANHATTSDDFAMRSFVFADAMLAEREATTRAARERVGEETR